MFNLHKPQRSHFLKGGKSENSDPKDFDPEQLAMGKKIQMEHTDDPNVAEEIAKDHLAQWEGLPYYDYLRDMEKKMERDRLKIKQHNNENLIYLKNNESNMKNIRTTFSSFINEDKNVTMDMRLNKDNKFKVVIEFDDDVVELMKQYNMTKIGEKENGDWILYDSLSKNYSILDSDDGEIIMDQSDNAFFSEKNKPNSAYRVVNKNVFNRMLEGL